MKSIKYIAAIAVAAFLNACDLLDIQPQNAFIPRTIEDYQSVISGAYPTTGAIFTNLAFLSDDIYYNFGGNSAPGAAAMRFFTWAESHEAANATSDPMWGALYNSIFDANTVLDALKEMSPSAQEKDLYETLLGEAYALRAWCYFYLANIYADVWSEENLEKPCVPMPLTASDVGATSRDNVRATIAKVWGQIDDDIEAAAGYLSGKPENGSYRFSYLSLQALKARVCLFMGRWDEAVAAATDVIEGRSLYDMNMLQGVVDDASGGNFYTFSDNNGVMDTDYPKEILLFICGKANTNPFYYWSYNTKPSPVIAELCMRYQPGFEDGAVPPFDDFRYMDVVDYRAYIYCSFADHVANSDRYGTLAGRTIYHMYGSQARGEYYIGLKVSEAYVTRAEALMRKSSPDKGAAVADLNALLSKRIRSSAFTPLTTADFATNDLLITRILEERRVETALESGLRWFDLRRLGKPELTHEVPNVAEQPRLMQGDLRYVLQIPLSEQIASPDMPLNPRETL